MFRKSNRSGEGNDKLETKFENIQNKPKIFIDEFKEFITLVKYQNDEFEKD
jgi:hypothetical protein